MSKKKIGDALIGSIFMGIVHSNVVQNVAMWPDLPAWISMKYICSEDSEENLRLLVEKYGRETWESNWHKVINREDIDFVSIDTPNNLHKDIGIEIANNIVHALCEAPLDISVNEAKEMPETIEKTGLKHCCGFPYRFTPLLALAVNLYRIAGLVESIMYLSYIQRIG